jgi:hypothetical protein
MVSASAITVARAAAAFSAFIIFVEVGLRV